jgi:hypothetical protein
MGDPLSSSAGKVAEEMMKEVQSAMKQADQAQQAQQTNPTQQFQDVLNTQKVGEVGGVQDAAKPNMVELLRAARDAQNTTRVPAIGNNLDSKPLSNGLQRIMEDVMQGQNKLEEIINLSLSGKNFSSSELLALQAGVYRFTQELELTSKVVEKGTSTIKQVMNTQV